MIALEPFPFPDQELLRSIIQETSNQSVLAMALERLDPIPENSEIFATHLYAESAFVRLSAILGTTDVRKLRELLLLENDYYAELARTRIAILEQDKAKLYNMAMNATYYDSEYAAIEALNDRKMLSKIVKRHNGETTPRASEVRVLVAAREAFLDRDAKKLDVLLKDTSSEIGHAILRMKTQLCSHAKVPPRVFISYKHESKEHKEWVMKLATDLRNNGINALLDEWEVDLGDSLSDYMAMEIARSDVMLFIITETSVAAVERQVAAGIKFEFQIANARRYQGANFRIVGVLRSGDRPPRHISDNLYIDFRNDQEYSSGLHRLVNSLLGRGGPPPVRQVYD